MSWAATRFVWAVQKALLGDGKIGSPGADEDGIEGAAGAGAAARRLGGPELDPELERQRKSGRWGRGDAEPVLPHPLLTFRRPTRAGMRPALLASWNVV